LRSPALVGVIAFCALATLLLGILPGPFLGLAEDSLPGSGLLVSPPAVASGMPSAE
jgi:hypothetical protein